MLPWLLPAGPQVNFAKDDGLNFKAAFYVYDLF